MMNSTKYHWQISRMDSHDICINNETEGGKKIHPNQKAVLIMRGDGQGLPLFNRRWYYEDEARLIVDEHNEQIDKLIEAINQYEIYVHGDIPAYPPEPEPEPEPDIRKEKLNRLMEKHVRNVLAVSGSLNDVIDLLSHK